jgi:hypothetical protein
MWLLPDFTFVQVDGFIQNPKQGGFTHPIAAHQTNALTGVYLQSGFIQQRHMTKGQGGVFQFYERHRVIFTNGAYKDFRGRMLQHWVLQRKLQLKQPLIACIEKLFLVFME